MNTYLHFYLKYYSSAVYISSCHVYVFVGGKLNSTYDVLLLFSCLFATDRVEEYLIQNPDFLENYVTRNVDQETLECWLIDRQKVAQSRKSSLSRWKYGTGSDTRRNMLQELARSLQRNSQEGSVMWELALCISSAVSADSFTLYLSDRNEGMLQRYVALNGTTTK
jgi:hypothetical protein